MFALSHPQDLRLFSLRAKDDVASWGGSTFYLQTLKVRFKVDGEILLGEGTQLPTNYQLFFKRGRTLKFLDHQEVLRGKVRIDTPAAALSYARLWSFVPSYDRGIYLEIMSRSVVDHELAPRAAWIPHDFGFGDGSYGIVSDKDFKRLQIPSAKVWKVGAGWKVVRPMERGETYIATEMVSSDGVFSRSLRKLHLAGKPKDGWHNWARQ